MLNIGTILSSFRDSSSGNQAALMGPATLFPESSSASWHPESDPSLLILANKEAAAAISAFSQAMTLAGVREMTLEMPKGLYVMPFAARKSDSLHGKYDALAEGEVCSLEGDERNFVVHHLEAGFPGAYIEDRKIRVFDDDSLEFIVRMNDTAWNGELVIAMKAADFAEAVRDALDQHPYAPMPGCF